MKPREFKIRRVTATDHGYRYQTFLVSGYLHGERVRRKFKTRDEALGEKTRLEVAAANGGGEIRAHNTRLTLAQLADAEAAFQALGAQPLREAVSWYLENYCPPVAEILLEKAAVAYLAARAPHIEPVSLRDYRTTLTRFCEVFPGRTVESIKTADVEQFMAARKVGRRRWNKIRGDLNPFFVFSKAAPRCWCSINPVEIVTKYKKTAQGLPEVITAAKATELMAYLETYSGGERSKLQAGCLVPYFALALFAGLRPSMDYGELWKLGQQEDVSRFIDPALKVIRITPEIAKTDSIRQVTMQPNLGKWLASYPVSQFPITPLNMRGMVAHVREKFGLSQKKDVLRNTYISMHVAKFRSLGDTALQAGNSEDIIKKHYLNVVSEAEAQQFWGIAPSDQ